MIPAKYNPVTIYLYLVVKHGIIVGNIIALLVIGPALYLLVGTTTYATTLLLESLYGPLTIAWWHFPAIWTVASLCTALVVLPVVGIFRILDAVFGRWG